MNTRFDRLSSERESVIGGVLGGKMTFGLLEWGLIVHLVRFLYENRELATILGALHRHIFVRLEKCFEKLN